jgi:hypothetical protein
MSQQTKTADRRQRGHVAIDKKKVIENYDIANSSETLHLAQDLARFIKENKLFHNIQGKAYVNVEGWQYAGARLGIVPVIESLTNLSTDSKEIKYQALVKLLDLKSQQTVGSGFAICSNLENGKRNYQEFAIASMAQTRAIGKAYRNILAWIIRAAGYEPTPAEEMDYMRVDTAAEESVASEKEKPVATVAAATDRAPVSLEKTKQSVPPEKLASVKQKTEILLLLNNKVITNEEKNKMIENINDLNEARATQAIARLKKVIEDRDVASQTA